MVGSEITSETVQFIVDQGRSLLRIENVTDKKCDEVRRSLLAKLGPISDQAWREALTDLTLSVGVVEGLLEEILSRLREQKGKGTPVAQNIAHKQVDLWGQTKAHRIILNELATVEGAGDKVRAGVLCSGLIELLGAFSYALVGEGGARFAPVIEYIGARLKGAVSPFVKDAVLLEISK